MGYNGGQQSVLHLVASADQVAQAPLTYVFTEGHDEMMISEFFGDLANLNRIDWPIMQATYWNDTRRGASSVLQHMILSPWEEDTHDAQHRLSRPHWQ